MYDIWTLLSQNWQNSVKKNARNSVAQEKICVGCLRKYRNGNTASKWTTHEIYIVNDEKGTRRQSSAVLNCTRRPRTGLAKTKQKCGQSELALCSLQSAATDKLSPGKISRTMLRRKRFRRSTVFGGAAPNTFCLMLSRRECKPSIRVLWETPMDPTYGSGAIRAPRWAQVFNRSNMDTVLAIKGTMVCTGNPLNCHWILKVLLWFSGMAKLKVCSHLHYYPTTAPSKRTRGICPKMGRDGATLWCVAASTNECK